MADANEFKERFVAVLQDMRGSIWSNPEHQFLIGSLAARLISKAGQPDWPAYKATLTRSKYDALLLDMQMKGNEFHAEGEDAKAYAMQVLAMSVIARMQTDPQVRAGNRLLDEMIDTYVEAFRKAEAMAKPVAN